MSVTQEDGTVVSGAFINIDGAEATTNSGEDGAYLITDIKPGNYVLIVTADGMDIQNDPISLGADQVVERLIVLKSIDEGADASNFPIMSISDAQQDGSDAADVSGILRAGRDVFQNATSFNLFAFRFSERGYNNQRSPTYLNGMRMNDPEMGWISFSEFGGLNDVLRSRNSVVGLDPSSFTFGDVGGAANIDTRASVQRKQLRVSYARSNRSYSNRIMGTYSTGWLKNGWAFSFSGSRRWAEEGYIPGTFYDAWSYFGAVDKKIGEAHNLSFSILAAPTRRGRGGDAFQEQYDLAGTNYFNPRWGFWNDKKRNASVFHNNQPIAMFRYDWKPNRKGSFTSTFFHQQGKRGTSRLDWFDAANPNADYNRNLPSAQPTPAAEQAWMDYLQADEANRQIDWAGMYAANQSARYASIQNADGIEGNTVSGFWSQYILEDQRQDSRESGANLIYSYELSDRILLQGGAEASIYRGQNFRVVDDLLGGDYYMDYDKFGDFDPGQPVDPNRIYFPFDLDNPDNVVREGERFGYDYDENIRRVSGWVQAQYTGRKFDFHVSGQLQQTGLWRKGNLRHYNYPNQSKGKSEILNFISPSVKGGIVYKINNRYYVYANGYMGEQAPLWQDAFLSPRVLNRTVDGITDSKVRSFEGGFQFRTPRFKGRLTAYTTQFEDEADVQIYFSPTQNTFGNLSMLGIDRQHAGIEAAVEFAVTSSLSLTAATNLGQYVFTSRPTLFFQEDNKTYPIIEDALAYQDGYYVPRAPQTAATFSARYSFKNYAFANLSFNWADNLWYEYDRLRRTAEFVETIEYESELWNTVLDQQKAPAAYTVDFFGGKSWKFGRNFLYLNVGVNNLLDNKEIITWGRDSYLAAFRESDDPRRYSSELSYSIGRNYFVSLTYKY